MSNGVCAHVFSLSPSALQPSASESSSPETVENILHWDTKQSGAITPAPNQTGDLLAREGQSVESSLFQMQDAIITFPENPLRSSNPSSQEPTLDSISSLVHCVQHESYPSPAETDFDFNRNEPSPRPSVSGTFLDRSTQDVSSLSDGQQNGPALTDSPPFPADMCNPVVPIDFLLDKPGDHDELALLDFSASERRWHAYLNSVTDNYGFDYGRPDLDLNKNDDYAALDVSHPLKSSRLKGIKSVDPLMDSFPGGYSESLRSTYYTSPVSVDIPRYLSPLPTTLLKNPINLMYFHHFINHTAQMLVPHDCEDNPFSSVLPSSKCQGKKKKKKNCEVTIQLTTQWLLRIPTS